MTISKLSNGGAARGPLRLRRIVQLLLLLLATAARGWGQSHPIVVVSVSVAPPYSPYLSDWERNPDRVQVTLRNTDPARSYDLRLSGYAENLDGSVRVETKDDYSGARRITVGAGGMLTVNARATGLFDVNAIRFRGTSSDAIRRSGQLPEGTYRVCIRALDYDRPAVALSLPDPPTCSNPFTIRYIDEPRPVVPICDGRIEPVSGLQYIVFQWIAPEAPAGTQYEFLMVEIPPKRSAEEAIRTATEPPLFRRRGLMTTSLIYTSKEPPLRPGARYAWRVSAVDPQGRVLFRRNGVGPACAFQYGDSAGRGKGIFTPPSDSTPRFGGAIDTLKLDPARLDPVKLTTLPANLIYTGCVGMTPRVGYAPGDPGQGTPLFSAVLDQQINIDAVSGGRLEIWKLRRRGEDAASVIADNGRRVFDKGFTGRADESIRYVKGTSTLDLSFVNGVGAEHHFAPEPDADYIWRFTMTFDGRRIRRDGLLCNRSSAATTIGRFPDINARRNLPDTLIAGGFTIVVEEWDATSRSADRARPSGIGRVKIDCSAPAPVSPWQINPQLLGLKQFEVVSHISDSAAQLDLGEALVVEPASGIGDRIELPVSAASRIGEIADRYRIVDYFRRSRPEGIRVSFRDVRWSGPVRPSVTLTDGIAVYPTSPAVPPPPAEVRLDSGFTLAIDTMTITPAGATLRGGILLPESITSATACSRARIELPMTPFSSGCELYQEVASGEFGRYHIGNTGLEIRGTGYIVDFSSTRSPAGLTPELLPAWHGVTLDRGETPAPRSDTVISNRGYLKGRYQFTRARVTAAGFEGHLTLSERFAFKTMEPFGYRLALFPGGYLDLAQSALTDGAFARSEIRLPEAAIRNGDNRVMALEVTALRVQPDMDLSGEVRLGYGGSLLWGEFSKSGRAGRKFYRLGSTTDEIRGYLYFAARQLDPYYPVAGESFLSPDLRDPRTALEEKGIQGVTFPAITRESFHILTADRPDSLAPLTFAPSLVDSVWMNVGRTGVHAEVILIQDRTALHDIPLGPKYDRDHYRGEEAFTVAFGEIIDPASKNKRPVRTRVRFVESAMFDMDLRGDVALAGPVGDTVGFRRMMFTSTADCAGGEVDLSRPTNLSYWGVQMVARDSGRSAGILSVRDGVIYLTAAGISEPRHFDRPFFLSWGEMRASGTMGRLFIDNNAAGQRFDRFPYTPNTVALSEYSAAVIETVKDSASGFLNPLRGYIHTQGALSIGFFGAKEMSISDFKYEVVRQQWVDSGTAETPNPRPLFTAAGDPVPMDTVGMGGFPFNGRYVRVRARAHMDTPPSQLRWERDWGAGAATFDYDMAYDSVLQDGFVGSGRIGFMRVRGLLGSTIKVKAEGSCFRVAAEESHGFDLAFLASAGGMSNIWGCGCIVGESLDQVALGGELSTHAGVGANFVARAAGMVSTMMSISPTRLLLDMNGDMYVMLLNNDVEVTGSATFIFDYGSGFVEGSLKGTVDFTAVVAGISGEGEFDWHLAAPVPGVSVEPYQLVQGRVAVKIYALAVGAGAEAGIFAGINAPKDRAWVMRDTDGRFGVNMAMLPDRLTGFYAYLNVAADFNVLLVSGGFRVYVGVGVFDAPIPGITPVRLASSATPGPGLPPLPPMSVSIIGNVGVYIYGKILGGLISAGGYANLQILAGIPPAFEGSVGLEACALWVLCGSVDVHCGLNAAQGFYFY